MLSFLMGIITFGVIDAARKVYNRDARIDLNLMAVMLFSFVGAKMLCDRFCDQVDNNRSRILNLAKNISNIDQPRSEVAGANAIRFEEKFDRVGSRD